MERVLIVFQAALGSLSILAGALACMWAISTTIDYAAYLSECDDYRQPHCIAGADHD